MKKILAIFLCVFLICAFPIVAFADEENPSSALQTETVAETFTTTEEIATEGEITGESGMPNITPEMIIEWGKAHFEEISVVITLIGTLFYNVRKHKLLNRSITMTNKNAITVAENSDATIKEALEKMEGISSEVLGYKEAFTALLEEFRTNAEEKQKLEKTLNEAMSTIKASKLANMEFADELAQLLVLANIPNSKKDELYSRHIAAVNAISIAEKTEVNTDDGGTET